MIKTKKISCVLMLAIIAMICFVFAISAIFSASANQNATYSKKDVFKATAGVEKFVCGEAFCDRFHVYNTDLSGEKETQMNVGKSYSGIGVYSNGSAMDFTYKNAVDFSDKTKDDTLIEIYPMFDHDGKEYAKIIDIRITLTDADDPSNTVAIHFDDSKDSFAIYSRALYRGKDISYSENRANPIYNGIRGTYLQFCTYNETHGPTFTPYGVGEVSPFNMQIDYSTKQLYASYYTNGGVYTQKTILDLDDAKQVGSGFEWQGFKNNRAYISVQVSFSEAVTDNRPGGVIIKSIDGVNLDGDFSDESQLPAPEITAETFDEYGQVLPYGAVGVDYMIPSVYAVDWYFGIAKDDNVSYVIEKLNGSDYVQTEITGKNGGVHKFAKAGIYRAKYTVTNSVKSAVSYVNFEIKEELSYIIISQVEEYNQPVLGEYLIIPETTVTGGSGNLVKTETLYYNGKEIELNEGRDVLIDEPGIISLKVECVGYTGAPCVKYFPVEVADGVIISVSAMPKAIKGKNSESLVLPEATAINTATGEAVPVSITVDGVAIGEDRIISTNKSEGTLSVEYSAGGRVKKYEIKVIDKMAYLRNKASLFIETGEISVSNTSNGVLLETSENGAGVTWAYPLVTGYSSEMMTLKFSQTTEFLDFDYIDVILSDYQEKQKDFFIRIYKDNLLSYSTTELTVKINGMDKIYVMNGAINNNNGSFELSIDGSALYNSSGNLVYDFTDVYNAPVSYVSVKFGGVDGTSAIRINQISNQNLYGTRDNIPVLQFSKKLNVETVLSFGKSFFFPTFTAHDATSVGYTASVAVYDEDDNLIMDSTSSREDLSFTPKNLGKYVIRFSFALGDEEIEGPEYYLKVVDNKNPVLTINGKIDSVVKAGKKITLPTATAKDDIDGSCKVYIFVRRLDTYGLVYVSGNEYTFTALGKYEIIYQTHDDSYNYTQYIFTVNVKGK